MEQIKSSNNIVLRVEGLQKYFPVRRGFLQKVVGWVQAVDDVPSPLDPPPGCRFQGRCPLVGDQCRKEKVGFYQATDSHSVRCWKVSRR